MGVGRIPVSFEYGQEGPRVMWMRQAEPKFGAIIPADDLAPILGLEPTDFDPRFPVQEVSTGFPFIIASLANLEAARRTKVNTDLLFGFIERTWAKTILVFCSETEQAGYDLHARVFVHDLGIPEDPATGSANGCLAAWLSHHRYFGSDEVDCKVEQGLEIGRPSTLLLRSGPEGDGLWVEVGGRAVLAAEGKLLV
jgi:trans-2,3-dihydro-3-hydroxyanthranilate isomerase